MRLGSVMPPTWMGVKSVSAIGLVYFKPHNHRRTLAR
jgi:hypothetical protein